MAEKPPASLLGDGLPCWNRLNRPQKALALGIAAYVVVFFFLAKRIYDVFGYDSGDTAASNNIMWWMIRGRPYYFSGCGDLSYLHFHTEFFWALLTPFYWIFPSVYTLKFLQSLALGLTAIPMYLIARRVMQDEWAAIFLGIGILFMPSIASGNLNQIQPLSFLPVALISAVYFFTERRWTGFCVSIVLSLIVRENVGLAIMMFGGWALVQRRSWKWILVPGFGGFLYFLVTTQVIIPWGLKGREWHLVGYFSHLGASKEEIIKNCLTSPGMLIEYALSSENLTYLVTLLQPVVWVLPLGSPAMLIALPDLAGNVLSNNNAVKVLAWHYQFITSSMVYVSAVFTISRVIKRLERWYQPSRFAVVAAVCVLLLCFSHWYLWFQPHQLRALPHHDSLIRAIQQVPSDKSVIVPIRLQAHVSNRARYDQINQFTSRPAYAEQFEYVVVDANEQRYPPAITREFFERFAKNPNYQMRFAENNVFVFQRLGGESDWKIQPK